METIMNGLTDLIMETLNEGFIIVAVCFAIGQMIKNSKFEIFEKIPNENIPVITAACGIILSFIPEIFPDTPLFSSMIKGAISGWSATGIYEFYRTYKKKTLKDECRMEKEVEEELREEQEAKEAAKKEAEKSKKKTTKKKVKKEETEEEV